MRVGRIMPRGVLIATAVTALACYDSDVPLTTEPTANADPVVIGSWTCVAFDEAPGKSSTKLEIRPAAGQRYAVDFFDDDPPTHFEGHASSLGSGIVVNLKDAIPRNWGKPWTLVHYTLLQPDILKVQMIVTELPEEAATSSERLRAFVAKGGGSLFVDACVCVRAKPSGGPSPKPSEQPSATP